MFPIMDPSGRVVAFSGRAMKKEDGIPKYVNSPETELFQKSEILYGYDKAKQGIRHYDFSLIVEGQFDVVLTHQVGYTNAVAVSGTAFTKHHMMLLSRFSPNVVLALDADRAGISAVKRSAVPLLQHGMNVKVAHMPDGQDPADVVRNDAQALKQIVGKSVHVIEFLLSLLKENAKDTRAYKLQVREEIIPLLVAIDNRIDREHFEGVVAQAIESTKEGVHYEVERMGESKHTQEKTSHIEVSEQKDVRHSKRHGLETHIRALLQVLEVMYPLMYVKATTILKEIISEEEYVAVFGVGCVVEPGEVFRVEHHIEAIREKQIAEELGDILTTYAHTIAREQLGVLRVELQRVEHNLAEGEVMTDRKSVV